MAKRGRGQALLKHLQEAAAASASNSGATGTGSSIITKPEPVVVGNGSDGDSKKLSNGHTDKSVNDVNGLEKDLKKVSLGPAKLHGEKGERVGLSANYIRLNTSSDSWYQYVVRYSPEVDSIRLKTRLLNEHRDIIGPTGTTGFQGNVLFVPRPIEKCKDGVCLVQSTRRSDGATINISIQFVKTVSKTSWECLSIYNTVFNRIMKILSFSQVGRNFYSPELAVPLPQHRLEIWPGYVTHVKELHGGLLLLLDVSHRVLCNDTVLDVMSNIFESCQRSNRMDKFQEECSKRLLGETILTRYNNKTYRVDDIVWEQNPTNTFSTYTGDEISYITYYEVQYGKNITDHEQPLLISLPKRSPEEKKDPRSKGPQKKICLIPELSYMTGLRDEQRANFQLMKDMGSHTRLTPEQRILQFKRFVTNLQGNKQAREQLQIWDLDMDPLPIELPGRVLPSETIILGRNRQIPGNWKASFDNAFRNEHVIVGIDLNEWMLFVPNSLYQAAENFFTILQQSGKSVGFNIAVPQVVRLDNDRIETYTQELRHRLSKNCQIVLAIFSSQNDARYSAVKKLLCCEIPVPSQVIQSRTLRHKNLRSIGQKVALQMNAKLGGELWAVNIPMKKTMVVGMDVYHSGGPSKQVCPSVLAMVASLNQHCTRFYSKSVSHSPGEEIGKNLQILFTAAIYQYQEANNYLPDRIVIFRDGVGDGQMGAVKGYELEQMSRAFETFGHGYKPKFAVVIVRKRISTRFMMPKGNAPPGTVVDHTVTSPDWYDFYLVSQHVNQGTVTPTHYVVVHDTSGLSADNMQSLAYKLTHMYYNWPGTIRVPCVCQYAHKMAYLVGQNLKRNPSEVLQDRLFYL